MDDRPLLYLEDVRPGDRFVTAEHTLTADEIVRFSREFDPQPFHLDDEAGRATFFGGLVASGWHTGAVTTRLILQTGPRFAGGILGVGGEISWKLPVRAGDVLCVSGEILAVAELRTKPDRGIVTMKAVTRNQRHETVQEFVAKIIVPRRP
jgi:acyl dehydratase